MVEGGGPVLIDRFHCSDARVIAGNMIFSVNCSGVVMARSSTPLVGATCSLALLAIVAPAAHTLPIDTSIYRGDLTPPIARASTDTTFHGDLGPAGLAVEYCPRACISFAIETTPAPHSGRPG